MFSPIFYWYMIIWLFVQAWCLPTSVTSVCPLVKSKNPCVKHLKRCKTSTCCSGCASVFLFPIFQHVWLLRFQTLVSCQFVSHSRGWMHGLAVIHQRRHCLSMVIWQRDAFVTYLLFQLHFCRIWPPAKPRTGMSMSIWFSLRFLHCCRNLSTNFIQHWTWRWYLFGFSRVVSSTHSCQV